MNGPGDGCLKRLAKYPALLREAEQMRGFARRVSFAVQHSTEGYGHAVFQSKSFANGEPVMLCLGDHLFRSKPVNNSEQSCSGGPRPPNPDSSEQKTTVTDRRFNSPFSELGQMAGVSGGRSVSAVNRISADELKGCVTIAGRRRADNPRLIEISLIIEKPALAVAQEKLHVDGLPAGTWLGWFGMHLLAPSIYDILAEMIRDNVRDNGEFQLIRAQEIQRQREGYLGLEMTNAERFDFGVPDDFVRSVQEFRKA